LLKSQDNLLIFYAGHGEWDAEINQGYWMPVDAQKNNPANWISNDEIRQQVKGMNCLHVLLISDACFAGSIIQKTRSADFADSPIPSARLYQLKSRTAITSGLLSEVQDESTFTRCLIKILRENSNKILESTQLFNKLREEVKTDRKTSPEPSPRCGPILESGDWDEGGDFMFSLKNRNPDVAPNAPIGDSSGIIKRKNCIADSLSLMRVIQTLCRVDFGKSFKDLLSYEFKQNQPDISYDSLLQAVECTNTDSIKYFWRYIRDSRLKPSLGQFFDVALLSLDMDTNSHIIYYFKQDKLVRMALIISFKDNVPLDRVFEYFKIDRKRLVDDRFFYRTRDYYCGIFRPGSFRWIRIDIGTAEASKSCDNDWWYKF